MSGNCCRSASMTKMKKSDLVKSSFKMAIAERDNKVIKNSMHDVPESLIPDRYKFVLVPQKS